MNFLVGYYGFFMIVCFLPVQLNLEGAQDVTRYYCNSF